MIILTLTMQITNPISGTYWMRCLWWEKLYMWFYNCCLQNKSGVSTIHLKWLLYTSSFKMIRACYTSCSTLFKDQSGISAILSLFDMPLHFRSHTMHESIIALPLPFLFICHLYFSFPFFIWLIFPHRPLLLCYHFYKIFDFLSACPFILLQFN